MWPWIRHLMFVRLILRRCQFENDFYHVLHMIFRSSLRYWETHSPFEILASLPSCGSDRQGLHGVQQHTMQADVELNYHLSTRNADQWPSGNRVGLQEGRKHSPLGQNPAGPCLCVPVLSVGADDPRILQHSQEGTKLQSGASSVLGWEVCVMSHTGP